MSTQVIILAGGLGKRMGGKMPKVLMPFRGRPMVTYLLDAVAQSGVSKRPVIVVGKMAEMVRSTLGSNYEYIHQREQLGTGHAVMVCREALRNKYDTIVVLYGDQPFVTSEVILRLVDTHHASHAVMTLVTIQAGDFKGWHEPFYGFGRIVRDRTGEVAGIVELKDCSEEQKKITEVNPSFFCFQAAWLWENIEKLGNTNAQKEYYLTDLLALAIAQGKKVATIVADPRIAIGINTPEQLALAEGLV